MSFMGTFCKSGQRFCALAIILGLIFLYKAEATKEFICVTKEIFRDEENEVSGKIALTFDDGPHPIYTPELLEGLKERGVVATFFVTGANASLYPELIEQMEKDGHVVGNHTYHHVQLSSVGEKIFLQELHETNRVLEGILEEEVSYVRPPFGDWSKSLEEEIDMLPVLWDVDPLDWCSGNTDQIVKKVVDHVEDNSIVLLHDEYATSVEAAFEIIDRLKAEGYEFVTVEHILLK